MADQLKISEFQDKKIQLYVKFRIKKLLSDFRTAFSMKKIMNIQKYTKFTIFLHEKETFLQKSPKTFFISNFS